MKIIAGIIGKEKQHQQYQRKWLRQLKKQLANNRKASAK